MMQLQTHPLTDFRERPTEHIRRLKETGQAEVLTVDGQAELVVQAMESYQRLLDLVDRAEAIEGIRCGLAAKARGESRLATEALEALRRKHGIPREP